MREISLTKGKVAIVDEEDYEKLIQFTWSAHKENWGYYAVTSIKQKNGKYKQFRMHRMILNVTDPKIKVDHKTGYTLDNRKENLRIASSSENTSNRMNGFSKNISGYRGVYCHKRKNGNRWAAGIKKDNKTIHLGFFDTAEQAAKAFDEAAKKLFGEFHGKLNFE